jgi:hypothetical protein
MSAHRSRRFDRRAAEQLLSGEPVTGSPALNDLLAAAAAPARDGEVAGEHAAVAAFRAARFEPVPQRRRGSMIKTVLAKLLTAKIAAAAAAVAVAAGGVAVAATGYLPPSFGGDSTVVPSNSSTATTSASDSSDHHSSGGGNTGDRGASASSVPTPSLVGPCRAYTAGADHGKALDSPAFAALITAAGGRDSVDAYCTTVLAGQHEEPTTTTTAEPTTTSQDHGNPAHGTPHPSTSHPDPGADHPTGAPTTHPGH